MSIRIFATAALGTMFLSCFAQEALTLESYRGRVLEYNQDVKKAGEGVKAADAQRKSIRTGFLPKIELQGDYTYNFRENPNPGATSFIKFTPHIFNSAAVLTQNIWDGGYTINQHKGSKLEKEIALEGENLTSDNIIYQADLVYWTASANKEMYEEMIDYWKIVKSLYEVISDRFEQGLISRTDLLMVETRMKEAELALVSAKMSNSVAQQGMNILMGEQPNALFLPSDSITKPSLNPVERTLGETLTNRSDFQMAELQVDLSKAQKNMAMAKVNPKIYAGVQGGYGNQNSFLFETWVAVGFVGVRVPLVQWGDRKYTTNAAKANIHIKELDLQKTSDKIALELSNTWTNVEESTLLVEIAKRNVEIADRNLEINTFSYKEGRLTILDVLQSQLSWIGARTSLIQYNMAHKMAISDYVRAVGGADSME